MELSQLFNGIYAGKKVLLTGHTGFKGTWMAVWLKELDAEVIGYSNSKVSEPCLFDVLKPDVVDINGDVRDLEQLTKVIQTHRPDIIFHMAAQALVQASYHNPVETFNTNITGTINVLEAVRLSGLPISLVNITSDKVYQNNEWVWGYRENDPLGGHDPYSASKAGAEIVINSYRQSFFSAENSTVNVASARAGNVIGGGDWADNRIIPDIMKAIDKGDTVPIRSPKSIRPWQHVLEPLSGYLMLGQKLLENNRFFCQAWNFGPKQDNIKTVEELVIEVRKNWADLDYSIQQSNQFKHEAQLLSLDCSKAIQTLKWQPVWGFSQSIEVTANWYKAYYAASSEIYQHTLENLYKYYTDAKQSKVLWANT